MWTTLKVLLQAFFCSFCFACVRDVDMNYVTMNIMELSKVNISHCDESTEPPPNTPNENSTDGGQPGPVQPLPIWTTVTPCSSKVNVTWLQTPPFIFEEIHVKNGSKLEVNMAGLFHSVIGNIVPFCCSYKSGSETRINYAYKAKDKNSLHVHIFLGNASMALPVYSDDLYSYGDRLEFIKVLESPGLVFITNKDNLKEEGKEMFWKAISNKWPVCLIALLLCAISGICVWALDTAWNSDEFPRRFHQGAFAGFWWAFITMSTVGYGDKAPKSVIARLFCIIWIMIGLTVGSIMTATLTTALTAASVDRDVQVVGRKIAVQKGSPAFQEVITQGGDPIEFDNFSAMHTALLQKSYNIAGILEEMYTGLYYMKQASDSRLYVDRVIKRPRSYGFALKEDVLSWSAEVCVRNLIKYRTDDVYTLMKKYMFQLQENTGNSEMEEEVIVLDADLDVFWSIALALAMCLGALVGMVLLGELAMMLYQKFLTGSEPSKDIEASNEKGKI